MKKAILLSLIVAQMSLSSTAATITAITDGDIDDPTTFNLNRVPVSGDDVIIPAGMTLTVPFLSAFDLRGPETTTITVNGELFLDASTLMLNDADGDAVNISPSGTVSSRDFFILPSSITFYPCDGFDLGCLLSVDPVILDETSPITGPASISAGALPVTLHSFEGKLENDQVVIDWITATEINNDYFILEKSLDGKNYTELGMIEGNGNSSELMVYQSADPHPAGGNNYYRLVQYDFNGDSEIHGPINVHVVLNGDVKVQCYPIPNNGKSLKVGIHPLEKSYMTELRITDTQGKVIHSESIFIDQVLGYSQEIQFGSQLRRGIYLLEIDMPVPYIQKLMVE